MKTTSTVIAIFAIIAAVGIGSVSAGLLQTAHADKNCSVGKTIKDKPSDWGKRVSENAKETGGNGDVFSGFNEQCHSSR